MDKPPRVPSNGSSFFARLYWIFIGNVLLFFLLVFLVEKDSTYPSLLDAAYPAVLASLIIVRYLDIRFLNGKTGEGEPATMQHWRRYAVVVSALGIAAWILCRVVRHLTS